MHKPVYVAHSSFIEGLHTTKNTASGYNATDVNEIFGSIKQNYIFKSKEGLKLEKYLLNNIILIIFLVLFTFSELPPVGLCLYYLNVFCYLQSTLLPAPIPSLLPPLPSLLLWMRPKTLFNRMPFQWPML
jgi:hypothetical protein